MMDIFSLLLPKYTIDKNKKIRLITLFSGYDSQKLAFDYLGIDVEHYRAIEFDKYAIQSLNEIHNTQFETTDITNVKGSDLGIIDKEKYTYIMTYSFPCTDLSLAGKRAGMDRDSGTRSGLLWEVERLLKETKEKPQILIMENVPQVLSAKGWREWNVFLEKLGYSNYTQILNAKDYGIPQNRERCFMVSILGEYSYEFPKPFKLKDRLKDFLEENVDEKYYLSEKMIAAMLGNAINKSLKDVYDRKKMIFNKNIAYCLNTRQDRRIGDTNYIIPKINKEINVLKYLQIKNDNIIPTRKLTPCECFKLMGVKPSDYNKITCSNAQKYKQAGNSIVTTVLMAIYSQLFENVDYKYYIEELLKELRTK